ncbi:MAG: glycosyltransferase family 87 protein [Elusimicrobia bacterium]|nr:glycosyltransferase family 87 protein [Elusimicrobiota bacterium]
MNLNLLSRKISLKTSLFILGGLILIYFLGIFYGMNNYDFKTVYDYSTFARLKLNIYAATSTTGCYCYYLPFFSILMIPFTFLQMQIASLVFFYLNIILLTILIANLLNDFKLVINTNRKKAVVILLMFLMIFPFLTDNIRLGQVDLILCFLGYFGLKYYYEKKLGLSAFCFAISGFKIITLIYFFFVLFSKKIKYILLYLTFLVFFILLPFLYFGILGGLKQYVNLFANNTARKISIDILLGIDKTHVQSFWRLVASFLKSFNISNDQILDIIILILLFSILIYTYVVIKKLDNLNRETTYIIGSVFLIIMLLFFPDLNSHHYTLLLIPFSLIVFRAMKNKEKLEIILISVIIVANIFSSRDFVGKRIYVMMQSFYLYMLVMLLLIVYLFYDLNKLNKQNYLIKNM